MSERFGDQAAGLRRLFGGGAHLRVISFLAATQGIGRTQTIAALAASLAAQGRQVLVVDENDDRKGVAAALGCAQRGDLLDAISGRCRLAQVLVRAREGLRILPAARASSALDQVTPTQRTALLSAVADLDSPPDVVLVDTRLDHPLGFSPFALAASEIVVTLTAQPAAIMSAYSLIKGVSREFGRRRFRVLINRAKSGAEAEQIYVNLARVAGQRNLAELDLAGVIPADEAIRKAERAGKAVTESHPESAAAVAIRHLATESLYWPCAEEPEGFEDLLKQLLHLSQHITTSRANALR